jgi:hypothetical protein
VSVVCDVAGCTPTVAGSTPRDGGSMSQEVLDFLVTLFVVSVNDHFIFVTYAIEL